MENSVQKLSKNTLIVTVGKISTQFISFLLLPLYTSILNSEQYGVVDLVQTLSALLLPLVSLQLEQATFRYLTASKEFKDKNQIISTAFFGMILQTIVYLFLGYILCTFINLSYKYFLIFNVITQTWGGFLLQIPRSFGDYNSYSLSSVVTGVSSIILNIMLVVFIPLGASGMLLAICIGNLIGCIFLSYNIKIYRYLSIDKFNKKLYVEFLKYSMPMIPSHLSWWIINASDRILISVFLGIKFNGIYAAAVKLPSIFNIAISILDVTWTEMLLSSSQNSTKFEENILLFKKIIKLVISCGVLMLSILPIIFKILIDEKFNYAYNLIPILVLGVVAASISTLSTSFYILNKDTRNIAKTSAVAAIINIIVHISLVKYIGLYASAISTAFSQTILASLRLKKINEIIKLKLNIKLIIVTLGIVLIEIICFYNGNLVKIVLGCILAFVYLIFINKDLINLMRK